MQHVQDVQESHFNNRSTFSNCSLMKPLPENINNIFVKSSIMYKNSFKFKNENILLELHKDWTEIENKDEWKIYPTRIPKRLQYYKHNIEEWNFNYKSDINEEQIKYIDKFLFKDLDEDEEIEHVEKRNSSSEDIEMENIPQDENSIDCCSLWSLNENICDCKDVDEQDSEKVEISLPNEDEKENSPDKEIVNESTDVYNDNFNCSAEVASPIFEVIKPSNEKSSIYLQLDDVRLEKISSEMEIENKEDSLDISYSDTNSIVKNTTNDESMFLNLKPSSTTQGIDFSEFDINTESGQEMVSIGNIINNEENDSKSSKVKILCHEIISDAPIVIEKQSNIDESKNISEFLCNEVYLNSTIIDDLSMFTENSNFNNSSLPQSSINNLSDTNNSIALINEAPYNTIKSTDYKSKISSNSKKSILKNKPREDNKISSNHLKAKKIRKKVSFDEAELVNNVKKRKTSSKTSSSKEQQLQNSIQSIKSINKKSTDQILYKTQQLVKNSDIRYDSQIENIKKKKKKKRLEVEKNKNCSKSNKQTIEIKTEESQARLKSDQRKKSNKDVLFENTEITIFPIEELNVNEDNCKKTKRSLEENKEISISQTLDAEYRKRCLSRSPSSSQSDQFTEVIESSLSSERSRGFASESNEHSNQVTELEAKVVDKLKNGMAVYKLHKKLPNGEKEVYSETRYYFNKVYNHLDILTPDLEANYNEGMMEIIVYDNEQFLKQYGENAGYCVIENYQLVVNSLLPLLIKDNPPKEIVVYDSEGNESMLQLDSLLQAIENHNAKKQTDP